MRNRPAAENKRAVLLQARLAELRARHPSIDPLIIAEVVRTVLETLPLEPDAGQAVLLAEVEELGRTIASVKAEIAEMRVDDINASHIPLATDELDAIVAHTATATDNILEVCETLDSVGAALTGKPDEFSPAEAAAKLQDATTRIYEACSFQDITGQRITKVVAALKLIESKVTNIVDAFGSGQSTANGVASGPARARMPQAPPGPETQEEVDRALLNGPQLPALAMDQSRIDDLLASFD